MRTYTPNFVLRLLVALFLIVPGIVLLVLSVAGHSAVMEVIGAPLLVIGGVLWWLSGRALLKIDDSGLEFRGYFGGIVKLPFADVTEYRYSSGTTNGVDILRLSVHAADGRKIVVTNNWRDPFDAAKEIVDGAEAQGLKEQKARLAGKRVDFGAVAIDEQFLVYGNKRVPFAEIKSVSIPAASLRVAQEGKLLAAFSVGSQKIPNLFLLLDELRARGVSAPDARPWRAVVSLAGYQLPKK
jgi:hypothetical protein